MFYIIHIYYFIFIHIYFIYAYIKCIYMCVSIYIYGKYHTLMKGKK